MWVWLRKTASRGRWGVPATFLRMRLWSRVLISSLVFIESASFRALLQAASARGVPRESLLGSGGSGLARLLLQHLAHVADALLLVRVGLAQAADLRRHLAHLLTVDAGDGDPVGLGVDRDLDAGRDRIHDGMRIAERE